MDREPGIGLNGGDDAAAHYVRVAEPLTAPYGFDTLTALGVGPGVRLLDLAAGAGAAALEAARRGAEVVAVDWSPGMVEVLAARAADAGLPRVTARVMDGQALDLPADPFDAACSVFGVMLFPDHRAGLTEMHRVLKPGGRAAVTVWADPARLEHMAAWDRAFRTAYPDYAGFTPPESWQRLLGPDRLRAGLEAAGFRDVAVRPLAHRWTISSAASLADNELRNPFIDREYDRLGPGSRERVRAILLAQLRARHGDGPFDLSTEAFVGVGTK